MKKLSKLISVLLILSLLCSSLISCNKKTGDKESSESNGESNSGESNSNTNSSLPPYGRAIGNRCIPTDLSLVSGDGTVNINDYIGKVVVINFWGTWCDPCKSELPHFDEVATEYADEVVIIAIHSVQGKSAAEPYVTENYPNSNIIFLYDDTGSRFDKYYSMLGCNGSYPYTLILDENGVITYKDDGVISKTDLISEIEIAKGETK